MRLKCVKKLKFVEKKTMTFETEEWSKKKLHAFDFNMKKLTTFEIDLNIS